MTGFSIDDPLLDDFTKLALGMSACGGAAPGEVLAILQGLKAGDDAGWHTAWTGMADRLMEEASRGVQAGQRVSAREAALRAGVYYGCGYRPFYGFPVDPRLIAGFAAQSKALALAASLLEPAAEAIAIPYEHTSLPGYFIPAPAGGRQPLLILTNGYDAAMHEMLVASALGAHARGYHVLIFDGPGQGAMLIERGIPMRPDWEAVVTPVVDYALSRSDVDADRVALMGWSLGGYLALRAATGERRLAAVIADPGLYSPYAMIPAFMQRFGVPKDLIAQLPNVDDTELAPVFEAMKANRVLNWSVIGRGFFVQDAHTLSAFIKKLSNYTLEGRLQKIACPTLITAAENDPLSGTAQQVFDALSCKKEFIRFTAAEGAGDHCEIANRPLFQEKAFDWLDATLGAS